MITKEEALAHLEAVAEKLIKPTIANKKEFGEAVRVFRGTTGLTPNQLARRCGVAVQTTYRWETIGVGTYSTATKVCRLFRSKVLNEVPVEPPAPVQTSNHLVKVTVTFELPSESVADLLRDLLERRDKTKTTWPD